MTTEPSDLIPFQPPTADEPEYETVNAKVAMAGLSVHTQRAYCRWIKTYLEEIYNLPERFKIDLTALNIEMALGSLGTAQLKAWLGKLKAQKLGKQSIMQAKASIVWMAQLMADLGRFDYEVPAGLSRVKAPRAETGQRAGTWLTQDEIRQLLRGVRLSDGRNAAMVARNTAIVTLMVTCGLRRDEVAEAKWSDLGRQGRNSVLKVHGKGEKMRVVKLPDMTIAALERWREQHPLPDGNRSLFSRVWKNGKVTTDSITDKAVWIVISKAAVAAGLPRISPHDLRRSFARGAYEAGVSFELIRQSLGHSSIATTERYVNSVLELDHAATDIWANILDED
ncbi:MAG: tyrosine-type recombinase/integrase [Anaerolineae bacterium]|nr:tyrosine-type recombinase/integrase [Anaerolineae bacterium]